MYTTRNNNFVGQLSYERQETVKRLYYVDCLIFLSTPWVEKNEPLQRSGKASSKKHRCR